MGRLRDLSEAAPASGGAPAGVNSTKLRGDALSDAAYVARRSADVLLETEDARTRTLASFASAGGVLALLFGGCVLFGVVQTPVVSILAAVSLLVPTAYALMQATSGRSRAAEASYERGYCQALAMQAKRLGDMTGATDQRNVPLGPDALVTSQLDALYKDLDRARQRLEAAGADSGQRTAANRMHERIVPNTTKTFLAAGDGRRYPVHIVDVSQSGVALKGSLPPLHQGEQVKVGARSAQVVKIEPGQVALQFLSPILPSELNKRIVL